MWGNSPLVPHAHREEQGCAIGLDQRQQQGHSKVREEEGDVSVPEGKGRCSGSERLLCPLDPSPPPPSPPPLSPAPGNSRQTLPLLGGREVAVALGGIVPRMLAVGLGNYIKGLGLFRNPYTRPRSSRAIQGLWKLCNNSLGFLPASLPVFF